jgi:O-antigen/teichoic acid export membrane protein
VSRPASQHSEGVLAARNALTLGTSLAMTAGMALVVRLFIPRLLGPASFGELRLAESFAELLFVILTFGVDMQLRREAAVDASNAQRYLAGLTALRLGLGAAGIAGTVLVLRAMGSSDRVAVLFVVTALSQVFLVLNNSYAALEHAAGDVRWLSRTNVVAKAVWAIATVAVIFQAKSAFAIAVTALTVESLRFAWFTARGIRRHQLMMRPDVRLAAGAVMASMPFFVNAVAYTAYARVGTGWLAAVTNDVQVGLYGAASNLGSIALLGMPLLSWVLVPSTARAAARSDRERDQMIAGALRLSLLVGVPLAAAVHVAAPWVVQLLFGAAYAPAAPVLRIMAPTVGLAYISTVCAIGLIQRGRTWTVAGISSAGLVVTVLLSALLIPYGARALGPSGGAQGAALATLGTEIVVTIALAALSRRAWLETRLLRTASALAGGVAAVALTMRFAPAPGLAASVLAAAAFLAAVLAMGGVDRHDVAFCRTVISRPRRLQSAELVPEAS